MNSQQPSLFELEPPAWELDDAEEALVAVVVPTTGVDGEFDYLIPSQLVDSVEVGRRVQAPFGRGNQTIIGYCIRVETKPVGGRKLKSLLRVIDGRPLLSRAMIELTRWMADYYLCTWGQVLRAIVPAGVRAQAGTRNVTVLSLPDAVRMQLGKLKLPAKQREVLEVLAQVKKPLTAPELAELSHCTQAPISTLRKKNLIESRVERVGTFAPSDAPVARESQLELNADQHAALDAVLKALHAASHQTLLIHGVTGSGKTEVYMQAIQEVIGFGRQAIVLVPEISLTPQTRERFRRRFDRVAVLHSHLTDVERAWHWEQIAAGAVQVIVGARSAIFAPTPHLGLIVLDEEHEASFKQDKAPRYHARDVALCRAQAENVPLVLGSATPSLESWHRAVQGKYRLIEMPRRVLDRPLPGVVTVDLRTDTLERNTRGAISRQLHQAMAHALREGGQIMLLLNRRGFSTHMQCPACGLVVQCPNCEIALTHHRHKETALCHYCEFEMPVPNECPGCGASDIRYSGRGTQKLEAEVRARFPGAACLRMDTDSMQKPGSHERALTAFREGEVQILLGTQMIAKGLDFPNVTLVGVINADTALHFPDFRAAERTFHLVTQVAGRTGRGEKGGRVLVQTFSPDHYAIQAAVRHDFRAFARAELPHRQPLYPPYGSMIRVVVRGPMQDSTREFATHVADRIRAVSQEQGCEVRVLGPAPAPMPKLRNNYRFHMQVQSLDPIALRHVVATATAKLQPPEAIEWMADVDPIDML